MASLTDVPHETLKNWRRAGYLRALGRVGGGTRGWDRFTAAELIRIAVMGRLNEMGLAPLTAHPVAQAVDTALSEPGADWSLPRFVVIMSGRSELVQTQQVRIEPDGPAHIVLPLLPVIRQVKRRAHIVGLITKGEIST